MTYGPGAPKPGTITGTALTTAFAAREKMTNVTTRHAVTNLVLRRGAEGGIVARHIPTMFRSEGESCSSLPVFVADLEDEWVEFDRQWKIAHKTFNPAFLG